MHILNFAHPLTPAQVEQTTALIGQPVLEIIHLPVQFDPNQPFVPQLEALVASIPLSPVQLQTEPILLVLPSLNFIAAMLLAHLHGCIGFFPAILRMRPVAGAVPPVFEAVEIINMQALRDTARQQRNT